MASAPASLDNLPEPRELHARLSGRRRLDWEDPLPTKRELVQEFGEVAAVASLAMLAEVVDAEQMVTEDFVAALPSRGAAYQLESRVKSPRSLARKVSVSNAHRSKPTAPQDVLRYTVVAPEPDGLVETAAATVGALTSAGWSVESAHHSYVEGSRYKGLHASLRAHGVVVELQCHSRESVEIKNRTTPLYQIERDPGEDNDVRAAARDRCIALSDGMRQPAGIGTLSELGGVPVAVRSYGEAYGTGTRRPDAAVPSTGAGKATPQQVTMDRQQEKGMGR